MSYLTELGLRVALDYDPRKSGPNYTFQSYLFDVMLKRTADFYRRQSEGFGDRRKGNEGHVLAGDTLDDEADPDVDFGKLLSARRVSRWQRAADAVDLSLAEFICVTMDKAASRIELTRHAA